MSSVVKILICSDVDYNKLIAEIYDTDQLVGIVSQESSIEIEFSKDFCGKRVELNWLVDILIQAKSVLLGNMEANLEGSTELKNDQ
jgi:hypothetical protein